MEEKQHFRSFNLPDEIDSLPFGALDLVVRLSRHFNFTTGKPVGREKLTKLAAMELLGLGSRTSLDRMLSELEDWSTRTGWWYLAYDRRVGFRLAVKDNRIGVRMSRKWTLNVQSVDIECPKNGHRLSKDWTLNVHRMDNQFSQPIGNIDLTSTLRSIKNS